jgi:hypothetical protein
MKKITKRNKIKVPGSWDDIGLEIFWHPKSDYIFYMPPKALKKGNELEVMGQFGKLSDSLKIKIDKKGNANLGKICPIDLAVLKIKLEIYGFKNYEIKEGKNELLFEAGTESKLKLKSKDEKAMFQVYFSGFIVDSHAK